MEKYAFLKKQKKLAIHKLGEKEICGYCFQTNKKHQDEYRKWEEVSRDKIVYDSSGKVIV